MSVVIPQWKHWIVAMLIGLMEGFFFIVAEAANKEYGFWQAFFVIVVLNALIYLVSVTRTR